MRIRLDSRYSRTYANSGFCERAGIPQAGHYSHADAKHTVYVGMEIHEHNGYTHTSAKTTIVLSVPKPKKPPIWVAWNEFQVRGMGAFLAPVM